MLSPANNLARFAWFSILAAVLTIGLKLGAFWLTNSVGLLSDALESGVNLLAAVVAVIVLNIASRPANDEFAFGFSKAEYFSSGFEGALILVAAGGIALTALPRLLDPQPIEQLDLGAGISIAAAAINFAVARVLLRAGQRYGSITLEADAHHLMTDVVTTAGVLAGVILVALSGWLWLDPVIALVVAANIVRTGVGLLRRSTRGLLDAAVPPEDQEAIERVLAAYRSQGIEFHAMKTRRAATRSFLSMHVLVPGEWSVTTAHELAEQITSKIHARLPHMAIATHVEPLDDPASYDG